LNDNKIGTRLLFSGNLTKQPYMKDINFKINGELKNTDFIMENTFWIGLYPGLTQEHLAYTVSKIDNFFKI
jgi:CDP-6-deoxy-D-xylo-4-hexulose-3-dehydrase